MRVAVCFSGLARTFAKCRQSYWDHILKQYICDVFICISKDQNSDSMNNIHGTVDKMILEKDPVLDEKDYARYNKHKYYTVQGLLQQYWKIKQCNDMMLNYQKQHGIHYDWVIRCRPDLYITRDICYLPNLDPNIMYMPIYSEWRKGHIRKYYPLKRQFDYITSDCLPDRFAISTPELMTTYASRWDELEELVKRVGFLYAENSICQHLKYHNVKVQLLPSMYNLQR